MKGFMNHVYSNRYGRLEIEIVGPYQQVSTMPRCKDLNQSYSFGMDEAEQIALITGNKDTQCCFTFGNTSKVFLIHHQSGNIAALCRIVSIEFSKNVNATKELERSNPYGSLFASEY